MAEEPILGSLHAAIIASFDEASDGSQAERGVAWSQPARSGKLPESRKRAPAGLHRLFGEYRVGDAPKTTGDNKVAISRSFLLCPWLQKGWRRMSLTGRRKGARILLQNGSQSVSQDWNRDAAEEDRMGLDFIPLSRISQRMKCTVALSADLDEELLEAAVQHAVQVHHQKDTPELRQQIRKLFKEGTPPIETPRHSA